MAMISTTNRATIAEPPATLCISMMLISAIKAPIMYISPCAKLIMPMMPYTIV